MLSDRSYDLGGNSPDGLAVTFAQPWTPGTEPSLLATLSGKASRFLARNTRTKVIEMRSAKPLVSFTFDDAPASACSLGAQILDRRSIRGTYYISGGGCGAMSPGGRLATIDELDAVHARGHEIGCHTFSHFAVASVSAIELATDLDRNKIFLRSGENRITPRNFAYPYGDLSYRSKRLLEGRFDSCRSLIQGVNAKTLDLGALKTYSLENASMDRKQIDAVIAETVRTRGWLIFSCHDVADNPSRFGVSPDLLAFAAVTAEGAGCSFVTIAEGLKVASGAISAQGKTD